MGRKVGNDEDRVGGAQPDRDRHDLTVLPIDPTDERQRQVHPLVILDPPVGHGLQLHEAAGCLNRTRLQVEARRIDMGSGDAKAVAKGFLADDEQEERPAAIAAIELRAGT